MPRCGILCIAVLEAVTRMTNKFVSPAMWPCVLVINNFFLPWPIRSPPSSGPGPLEYRSFTITFRHTTLGRTPLHEWSARRRDLYQATHNIHKKQTFMPLPPLPGLIRTRNPRKRAAAYPRLTSRGHWDRQSSNYRVIFQKAKFIKIF